MFASDNDSSLRSNHFSARKGKKKTTTEYVLLVKLINITISKYQTSSQILAYKDFLSYSVYHYRHRQPEIPSQRVLHKHRRTSLITCEMMGVFVAFLVAEAEPQVSTRIDSITVTPLTNK